MIPLLGRVNAGAPAESLEYKEGEVCVTSAQVNDYPAEQLFADPGSLFLAVPAKGRKVRHELFYMVRVGRLDGKYVIAGTGFRL